MRAKHLSTRILLEYRRDITARHYAAKLISTIMSQTTNDQKIKIDLNSFMTSRDVSLQDLPKMLSSNESLQQIVFIPFEKCDPTQNFEFVPWIINRFIKESVDDIFSKNGQQYIKKLLSNFVYLNSKNLLKEKDINKYTYALLVEQCDLYPIIQDTKVLYNGPEGQLVIPETLKSSMSLQHLGQKTEWCTADSRAPTYYPKYTANAPLYVWIDHSGDKFQFHFYSYQFQKADNTAIKPQEFQALFNSRPHLFNYMYPIFAQEIKRNPKLLTAFSEPYMDKFISDLKLDMMTVLKQFPYMVGDLPEKYITEEIVTMLLAQNEGLIERLPVKFIKPHMIITAIRENVALTMPLLKRFPQFVNHEFIMSLVASNTDVAWELSEAYFSKELVDYLLKEDPVFIKKIPEELITIDMIDLVIKYYPIQLFNNQNLTRALNEKTVTELVKIHGMKYIAAIPDNYLTDNIAMLAITSDRRKERYDSGWRDMIGPLEDLFLHITSSRVIAQAIKKYPLSTYAVASNSIKTLEWTKAVISKSPELLSYVPNDQFLEILPLAVDADPVIALSWPEAARYLNDELVFRIIKKDGNLIEKIPKDFRTSKLLRLAMITATNRRTVYYCSDLLRYTRREPTNLLVDCDPQKYPTLADAYLKYGNRNFLNGESSILTKVPISEFEGIRKELSKFSREVGGRYRAIWRGKRATRRPYTKRSEATAFSVYPQS
jgi:hypothetical protein